MSDETSPLSTPANPGPASLILTLGIIAMMSGLLVVTTYQVTKPIIAANRQEALEKAVFSVLPEATSKVNFRLDEEGLRRLEGDEMGQANLFAGYDETGELAGIALEGAARGYQDVVRILYGYSPESECVIGMTVMESTETPGLGDKVETDPDFLANFECLEARLNEAGTAMRNEIVTVKSGEKTEPWQIDGISGATVTSQAIGTAIRRSSREMLPLIEKNKESLKRTIDE
ncbi:MAG: FMN-binding protein [Oceanipulchritudo sp.]